MLFNVIKNDFMKDKNKSRNFSCQNRRYIQLVQKEYLRLAQLLWDGTDPLAPKPLEDRDIFELLGFD